MYQQPAGNDVRRVAFPPPAPYLLVYLDIKITHCIVETPTLKQEEVLWKKKYTKWSFPSSSQEEIEARLKQPTTYAAFFTNAPAPNPNRRLITGRICGVRVEEIRDPLMQEIRYLDKLIDELAKGKTMDRLLRK